MIQIAELINFIQETIYPRVSVLHCHANLKLMISVCVYTVQGMGC